MFRNTLRHAAATTALLLALASAAMAGEFAGFEHELRAAYADYRAALFMTNAGKADASKQAIEQFAAKWAAIESQWAAKAPPQYEDDAKFAGTLAEVTSLSAKAAGEIGAGKLADAHETLEGVREAVASLHLRNGITSFSDRMNAYHAAMEAVLGTVLDAPDAAGLDQLHERAAVLAFLAAEAFAHPPAEVAAGGDFATLADGVKASVEALLAATRARDPEAIRKAAGALKPAYAKLFVKYG